MTEKRPMAGSDNETLFYEGRLAIQQRVLPAYRGPFLEALARRCRGGLSLFAGQPQPGEQIVPLESIAGAHYQAARNRYLFRVGSPFYRCWQQGLLAWLETWQPDALIVEANARYATTPSAVAWMHARCRPVLGWGLGAPPLRGWLAPWRRRARQRFLLSLDGLIAYSRQGAEEYRRLGFPPERVFVAPNAVTPRPKGAPPSRPPLEGRAATLLFVGRLQARKRVDHLLWACAALPASLQPRLLIVGEGPARPALEALAQQVYPQAEFCGARYGVALEALFAQADLFVLPGTGGLAAQQALAQALPLIVAEGDGTQNDLVRPTNGWLIPPNDPEALRHALQEALSDPQRLRRMGAESFRLAQEEFNIETMVTRFIEALHQVSVWHRA